MIRMSCLHCETAHMTFTCRIPTHLNKASYKRNDISCSIGLHNGPHVVSAFIIESGASNSYLLNTEIEEVIIAS